MAAVMDRAVLVGQGRTLDVAAALGQSTPVNAASARLAAPGPPAAIEPLDAVIRRHIEAALQETHGRVEGPHGAARLLRINPHTLRARMRKLKIDWRGFRGSGSPSPPSAAEAQSRVPLQLNPTAHTTLARGVGRGTSSSSATGVRGQIGPPATRDQPASWRVLGRAQPGSHRARRSCSISAELVGPERHQQGVSDGSPSTSSTIARPRRLRRKVSSVTRTCSTAIAIAVVERQ